MTATLTPPRPPAVPPEPEPQVRTAAAPPSPVVLREDRRAAASAAGATLLGSLALVPVFTTSAWFWPVLAVVLAVWGGGLLARRAGRALWARLGRGSAVPSRLGAVGILAVPVVQATLVTCVMTVRFAPDDAWAGFVPTPTSVLALNAVLLDGTAELREQATPALPLTGLLALTALLVGLVAVAVDLIAVGLRAAPVAGLGLLALYCVPVSTVTGSVGLTALLAPAAGFALLLWSDQRRRLSGRDRPSERASIGSGVRTALRVTVLAMATGVVVGALLPTLPEFSVGTGLGSGSGPGGTVGTALDPVARLQGELTLPEPVDLLTVEASVTDLGHLRSVALDQYDAGDGWTMSNLDGEISVAQGQLAPLPPGQTSRPVSARITAEGHNDRFLPVPWAPQSVSVPDPENWRYDPASGTIFGRETTTERRTWFVTVDQPQPSPAQLQDSPALDPGDPIQQRFTDLPELDPAVTSLVSELVAGAQTPYQRVRRINDYLSDRSNGFIYSLSTAPGTSDDDLVNFLNLKRGYCEQYAGAMAVLVRAADIPARMVLGHTPGDLQDDGTRLITTDDNHAWVEVYFAGLGWVPFDPTPISPERAVQLPWAPSANDPTTTPGGANPSSAPTAAPTLIPDRGTIDVPTAAAQDSATGWLPPLLIGAAGAVLVAAAVAVPATARMVQRRRRIDDGRPGALWDELGATVRDLGLPTDAAATPRQSARHLAELAGHTPDPLLAAGADDALRRLALAEEAESYGPARRPATGTATGTEAAAELERTEQLRAHLRTARKALLGSVPRRTRLRAMVWPSSLISTVLAGLSERAARLPGRLRLPGSSRPA